jgi:hypothetical protein
MAVGVDHNQSIGMDDDSDNDGPRASTSQLDGEKSYDYSDSYPAIERVLKQMRARLQVASISKTISSKVTIVDAMTTTHPNLYAQSITPSAKDVTISSLDVSLTDTDDLSDQVRAMDYEVTNTNVDSSRVRTVNDQILSVKDTVVKDTTIGSNLALLERDESVTIGARKSRDEEIAHIREVALNIECLRKRKVFIAKHLASLSVNRPPLCPSRSLDTLSCPS